MSTRGVVAVRQPDGTWKGIYSGHDAYPTGLGKSIWRIIKERGIKKVAEELFDYDCWDNYLEDNKCSDILARNPDAYPRDHITSDSTCPIWIEYVYVLDVQKQTMEVFESFVFCVESRFEGRLEKVDIENLLKQPEAREYTDEVGKHIGGYVSLGVFPVDGQEPNWDYLEDEDTTADEFCKRFLLKER